MKELNPIIRNAIATALHAESLAAGSAVARTYVEFNVRLIPNYWEEPALLQDFDGQRVSRLARRVLE